MNLFENISTYLICKIEEGKLGKHVLKNFLENYHL